MMWDRMIKGFSNSFSPKPKARAPEFVLHLALLFTAAHVKQEGMQGYTASLVRADGPLFLGKVWLRL